MAASTLSFALFISLLSVSSLSEAQRGGFTVELIHRDSPKSPFHNPSLTSSQRFGNAFRRSISRANLFRPTSSSVSPNSPQSILTNNAGEYLMQIAVGTPPVKFFAIADTGSDLTWTQCKPCTVCYKQKTPLFDPKSSSTYRNISCSATQCTSLHGTSCDIAAGEKEVCKYEVGYGDSSFTIGNLAVDTVTLDSTGGRPVAFLKTVIGCGHNNDGTFDDDGSGIIGLGNGAVSLISQMGPAIDGKFSYCLIPLSPDPKNSSKINFGANAIVSGSGALSTPIVHKEGSHTSFYYLTLEGISVGTKRFEYAINSGARKEGNIIIDSGTTLTILPADFFEKLESEVIKSIGSSAERVDDPTSAGLSLCYKFQEDLEVPLITAHFRGADVEMKAANTFVRVSDEAVCFAFVPTEGLAIYGNIAQMDFLVGYDLKKKTVSFKPTHCSKH